MRVHDLRSTTATLLARSGVGFVVAQRILRHSDPRLTTNIYSRVDLVDLQAGIDRIPIPSVAESTPR
jgi:integrase